MNRTPPGQTPIRNVDVATERVRQHDAVDAFLNASRDGDFGALLQLLDPDVELRGDGDAVATAAPGVSGHDPRMIPEGWGRV